MPKMRTHSASKKRFRKTASGKIKHMRGFRRHHAWAKTAKQIRQLRRDGYLSGGDAKALSRLLPYS